MFVKSLTAITILAHLAGVSAYPWMEGHGGPVHSRSEEDEANVAERDILGLGNSITTGLGAAGGALAGLLGSVASAVNPNDKRPDAAHPFKSPSSSDQRGPCPGLNALANHGYISRSGIVNAGEVIAGVSEGFNMGADLAALLVFVGITFGGNLATSVFSIGGEDSRTYSASGIGAKSAGRQYGLDGHSRCEGDISAMRRDFYLNNGDNHNAYPDRFKRFIKHAQQNGNEFNVAAANALYAENARESLAKNPKLFFNSYIPIVVLGEYPFIPNFMSNGTYGAGGVANYESISSIYGMSTDKKGKICYVPERFPNNWYRRSVPYGVVDLVAGLAPTYLTGPPIILPNPLSILQNPAQLPELGCAIYQGITSGIPASLAGETNEYISAAVTYLQKNLFPTIPSIYGCSPNQPSLQADGKGGEQYKTPSTGAKQGYQICA